MTLRSNRLRRLAISAATLAALFASANMASASLSTVDQTLAPETVAATEKTPEAANANAAADSQDDVKKQDEQSQAKDHPRKARHQVATKVIPGSNGTVCKPVGNGLCKVLHVQNQPTTLLRPVRVMRLGGGFFR